MGGGRPWLFYSREPSNGTWPETEFMVARLQIHRPAVLVTGAGAGAASHVRALDPSTTTEWLGFYAYDTAFSGGVRVAAGDLNGDGVTDVVVGAGPGGGPQVRVLDGTSGRQIAGPLGSFMAFDPSFTGGVFVAAGQCHLRLIVGADAGGGPHVIVFDAVTGPGPGGGPHVRIFDGGTLQPVFDSMVYDPSFQGGVFVGGR